MTEAAVERFRALTPSEFFYRNKELAGFSNPARALYQTVRELIENALDATDSHMIRPVIKVVVRREGEDRFFSVTVEDNGIGIPPAHVPQAFGQLLYSSKYVLRQTRGMFGLGAKMAVLYGQMTAGKPVEVVTSTILSKRIHHFKVSINIKSNTPSIVKKGSYSKLSEWHGTSVRIYLEGDWMRSKSKIYEYLKRTAIIAPYADIIFEDPEGNVLYFERSISKLPIPPREVKPHPKGVDLEMLKMMASATKAKTLKDFLVKEFQSVGEVTALRIISRAGLDPRKSPKSLRGHEVERLVRAIKEDDKIKPPKGDHLSFVGPEIIEAGLKAVLKPEFVAAVTRKPSVYGGHAFIVEAGIAYGGEIQPSDKPVLYRYANKIPLLYDEGSDVSRKVIDTIDWGVYGVSFPAPLAVLVHICSTKVPYKGVGKESVADVPEVQKEIELAVREVARRLRRYLMKKRREREEAERAVAIVKYIPELVRSLKKIVGDVKEDMLEKELLKMVNMKLRAMRINSVDEVVVALE
ncbi:MAG: DNA topoisomerase VI subunit B [Desulfurococcales archaeon]|nr:DNA topoisomerase VI subunit B [Desulfurococcales archaeon]